MSPKGLLKIHGKSIKYQFPSTIHLTIDNQDSSNILKIHILSRIHTIEKSAKFCCHTDTSSLMPKLRQPF